MKPFLKVLIISCVSFLCAKNLKAQEKFTTGKKAIINKTFKQSTEDSLYLEISNTIYYTYYNPAYMSNKTPVFTILKVDVDWAGKVTNISFSDSADSVFVKAWQNKPKVHDDKATFERYSKEKSYKNVSLLIPISYEPQLPNSNKYFTNDYLETYLKFDKKAFVGNAIMLPPITITVLEKGNM